MMLPGMATELDRREAEPDKRDREDDPTPRALVRAIIEAAAWTALAGALNPVRVLDVCAGYGCWSSEWRRWWMREFGPHDRTEITGVEICEARREHLRKWCDRVAIRDWFDFLRDHHELPQFDLVVGNPHFSALVSDDGDPDASMPAVCLQHASAVLLYHTRNAFLRSKPGRDAWRAYPPARVFMIPGTVSHDGTSSVASDCYQASLWLRGFEGETVVQLLDAEPEEANLAAGIVKRNGEPYRCWRWTVPPGSEEPSEDLPGVVGWAP
jgi:SAM-dependent methyltransferase